MSYPFEHEKFTTPYYMNSINVTCALIERENQVLVVQRSKTMSLPLKWEFPGGKIEKGESETACLKREVREELSIEVVLVRRLTPSSFSYPTMTIRLIPFVAKQVGGNLKLNEHVNFKYLHKSELLHLDWAEADIPIVKEYISL